MYKYFRSKRHSFEPNLMQEPLNRMNFIQMFRYYYFPVKNTKCIMKLASEYYLYQCHSEMHTLGM